MIVAELLPDGTERKFTPEEARAVNKRFGLSDRDQEFIRSQEAGEIDGDVELIDADPRQTILPFRPHPID